MNKQIYRSNEYDTANFFSKVTFTWPWNFFLRNYGKELKISDLEKCPKEDKSARLGKQLEENWNRQLQSKNPNFFLALHATFGWRYHLHGIGIAFTNCVLIILQTVVMGWLIKGLLEVDSIKSAQTATEAEINEKYNMVYIYGFLLVVLQGLIILMTHPYFFHTVRIGMDMRIATCRLIYKKTLKLSKSSTAQTTLGQIVNYLSNDVNRFDWLLAYPHYLLIGPVMTVIVTLILFYMEEFGNECLPGICILLLYIPFQGVLGKLFTTLREKTAALTDERVRITKEFVRAIKVIKMYAWEEPFCNLINNARKKEVEMIKKASFLRGLNLGLFFVATKIILFVMLFLYVYNGKALNSGMVFVAMSLVNQLRSAVCLYVPYAISTGAESLISIKRIQEFLLMEEFKSLTDNVNLKGPASSIKMEKVSTKYTHMIEDLLSNISMEAKPGELVAVIGPVGSGKSSFLMTLLGELPATSGSLKVNGKVSYAAQEAWIFPATIRENILFGSKFDLERYQEVVQVCCLDRDFVLLPNGDKTVVGDTGLSGGQKARVNLARCLYNKADIYLLDDPLSAVDANVGKHMFEQAIKGFLKDKICVLITHQLQFIKSADKILLLKNGQPEVYGPYAELLKKGIDFIRFNPGHPAGEGESDTLATIGTASNSSSGFAPEGTSCNHTSALPAIGNIVEGVVGAVATNSPIAHRKISQFQRQFSRQSIRSRAPSIRSTTSSIRSTTSHARRDVFSRTTSVRGSILASSPHDIALPICVVGDNLNDIDYTADDDDIGEYCDEGGQDEGTFATKDVQKASGRAYWIYMLAGGGIFSWLLVFFFMVITQVLFTFSDWWLSVWTDYVEHSQVDNSTLRHTVLGSSTEQNIIIYSCFTGVILFLAIVRTLLFFLICMRASVKLHDRLFRCLSRAPMAFFDLNPVGILLNRCSRDMGIIDDILPPTMFDGVSILFVDTGCAIMICFIDVWIILPSFFALLLSYFVRKVYMQTAIGVKRLEGATRSPVLTCIATSHDGLTTIRAWNAYDNMMSQFDGHQDGHTAAWFHFISASRWFGVTLDWLCFLYIAAITISMLASSATGANVGLVITSAILLETGYQWAIRQLTEVDTQMTCVSRVDEYAHIPPEKGYINTENPPPSNWPDCGSITFQKACLAYNEANTVLHDLTFVVKPKEKIGIVGRTGAGKSSIINALFRLIELTEGSIIIDGIDINSVGLHDLRKKISIIPQEPVLFSATIRKNLDPFDQKPDGKIWRALDQVMLRETVQDIPKGLEAFTSEEMNHFSLGQRQLLCLARAILQKNNILILDEATANVDPKTDETIQKTIRTAFKDSTVITIAHRLDTVIDNDRILVLESGRLAEFDTPHNLLSNEESIFSNMVRATGWDNAKKLMMAARRTADAKDKLERMASNQSSIIDNNYASEISVTSNSSII